MIGTSYPRYSFWFEVVGSDYLAGTNQTVNTTSSHFSIVHNDVFKLEVDLPGLEAFDPKAIAGITFLVRASLLDAWGNRVSCCCSKESTKSILTGSIECFNNDNKTAKFFLYGQGSLESDAPVSFINGEATFPAKIVLASKGNVIQGCEFDGANCVSNIQMRQNTSSFEVVHNNQSKLTQSRESSRLHFSGNFFYRIAPEVF